MSSDIDRGREKAHPSTGNVLECILEMTLAGYWDWDLVGNTEYLSPRFKQMLGYEDHELANKPETWQSLIFPEDLPGVLRCFNEHVKSRGKAPYYNEVRYRHKNGSIVWVICTGRVIEWDKDGRPLRLVGCHIDITERKKIEEALVQSEERFREMAALLPEVVFETDIEGRLVFGNLAAGRDLGYTYEDMEKGINAIDMIVPEERERAANGIKRILAGETIGANEFTALRKDGTRYPILVHAATIFRDDKPVGMRGIVIDISVRKAAEEAVRHEAEFRESIIESAAEGICVCHAVESAPGIYFSVWNRRMTDITGYTVDEINGLGWYQTVYTDPETQARAVDRMNRMRKGENLETEEWEITRKDGERRTVLISTRVINTQSGMPGVLAVIHDITGRKRAEEALRESERRYRSIVEHVNDAFLIHDFSGNIFDCNENACKMLGYSRNELVGAHLSKIDSSKEIALMETRMNELIKKGLLVFDGEHVRKNGSLLSVNVSASIVSGEGDGLVQSFVRDITERKRAEENLVRAQKLESLGLLAGGIAHDFNNLLAGVFGHITLAQELLDQGDVEKANDDLTSVLTLIDRARALTRQLLTFSRGGTPVRQPGDIGKTVMEAVKFALSGSNVRYEFSFSEDLPHCEYDPNLMGQVIDNVVINAKQAMPEGGTVVVSGEPVEIVSGSSASLPPGRYVKITIKDTGIGIPKEHLSKVFDPFFTTKQTGSGLGLTTSWSIMKRHNGHIDVESETCKGTSFMIYLPASTSAPADEESASVPSKSKGGRILLMDDEEFILRVGKMMLESLGYTVVCATKGEECISLFKESAAEGNPFDAAILDLTIRGGMGGRETIAELLKIDPSIRSIASSGYSDDPVMSDPRRYGYSGSLRKPYTMAEMADVIAMALGKGKQSF